MSVTTLDPGGSDDEFTKRSVPCQIGDQKVDVHRLSKFAMAQRRRRATAEKAVVGGQKRPIQRPEGGGDPLVVRPLKQGGAAVSGYS